MKKDMRSNPADMTVQVVQAHKRALFSAIVLSVMLVSVFMTGGCGRMEESIRMADRISANTIPACRLTEEIAYGSTAADEIRAEYIAAVYCAAYEEAVRTNTAGSLEMMRNLLAELGRMGYAAVDCDNQIDMVNAELVMGFNEAVEAGERAGLTIVVPAYSGSLLKYDFEAEKGEVKVVRNYYQYENGAMKNRNTAFYLADVWQYTEEGYLFFQGSCYTEESYVLVCSDEPEYAGFRVAPLEEKCRELNRKYILPIGYDANNLFMMNWSEEDFTGIDFYDMFDVLYEETKGRRNPYVMDSNPNVGVVYAIPEEEFESVILQHFKVDCETLHSETKYFAQDKTYEYRPRGFYELGYSNVPCPEVVDYAKKQDGTLELTVNAVFPYENTAKVYTHKVVVRPTLDGGFQYVSNEILTPEEDYAAWWYSERLTEAEWETVYEGTYEEKEKRVVPSL